MVTRNDGATGGRVCWFDRADGSTGDGSRVATGSVNRDGCSDRLVSGPEGRPTGPAGEARRRPAVQFAGRPWRAGHSTDRGLSTADDGPGFAPDVLFAARLLTRPSVWSGGLTARPETSAAVAPLNHPAAGATAYPATGTDSGAVVTLSPGHTGVVGMPCDPARLDELPVIWAGIYVG